MCIRDRFVSVHQQEALCMYERHQTACASEHCTGHVCAVVGPSCHSLAKVVLQIQNGHLVNKFWRSGRRNQLCLLQELKAEIHQLDQVLLHQLNIVLFVNCNSDYVFIVCILFDFCILLVAYLEFTDAQGLDYRLEVLYFRYRGGRE